METLTYGFVITVVGMGGTLFSLWLLILTIHLLKKLFPYRNTEDKQCKEVL